MDPREASLPDEESGERIVRVRMPAWLMSVVLHVAALVVGAVVMQGGIARTTAEPPPREVGIVLADANATGEIEYFQEESDAADASAANPQNGEATADAQSNIGGSGPMGTGPSLPDPSIVPPDQLVGDLPIVGGEGIGGVPKLRVAGRPQILPGLGDQAIIDADKARQRPTGPQGPQTKMSLFGGAPAVGNSFVFLIDRSQSMGGDGLNGLAAAEKELNYELAKLDGAHKFQIIAYNQQVLYLTQPGMLPASAENRAKGAKFLAGLVAFAGTQHEAALMAGLRLKPDVIFILTDGGDPLLSEQEIARVTERNRDNGMQSSIHCIHFGSGPASDSGRTLRELVKRNGGSYGYVDMNGGK